MKDSKARFVGFQPTITLIIILGGKVFLEYHKEGWYLPSVDTTDLVESPEHLRNALNFLVSSEILIGEEVAEAYSLPLVSSEIPTGEEVVKAKFSLDYAGTYVWQEMIGQEKFISVVYRFQRDEKPAAIEGDELFDLGNLPARMLSDERRMLSSFSSFGIRKAA